MDYNFLIAVSKSAHAAHDTKDVIVRGIHTHLRAGGGANGVVGHGQQKGGVINTR